MWQITLEELMTDSFRPVKVPMHPGSWAYECPMCGKPVGIYRTDDGLVFKRDKCLNGHVINWENYGLKK